MQSKSYRAKLILMIISVSIALVSAAGRGLLVDKYNAPVLSRSLLVLDDPSDGWVTGSFEWGAAQKSAAAAAAGTAAADAAAQKSAADAAAAAAQMAAAAHARKAAAQKAVEASSRGLKDTVTRPALLLLKVLK